MQPSEIDDLDLHEFVEWVEDAVAQIQARERAMKEAVS
jgi:hypothetical protein